MESGQQQHRDKGEYTRHQRKIEDFAGQTWKSMNRSHDSLQKLSRDQFSILNMELNRETYNKGRRFLFGGFCSAVMKQS
jgi:hypothetical protein